MKFKKLQYDWVYKYDSKFQNAFVSHYMMENGLQKKFNKYVLNLNLKKYTLELEDYVVKYLYNNNFTTKKNIKLENIHKYISVENQKQGSQTDITRNELTAVFFQKEKKFFDIYLAMINEVKKKFEFKFLFQKDPFLRFNFPSKSKVDTFLPHVDLCIGHPPGEINFWLPVTDVLYNNSLLVSNFEESMIFFGKFGFNFMEYEKVYNKKILNDANKILKPFISNKGNAIVFDSRVMHKTILNKSQKTRVSLDFRILPLKFEKIAKMYRGTGYKRQRFTRGKYYNKKSI